MSDHTGPDEPPGDAERRRRGTDDDLLTGFDRPGRPVTLRAFFATTITASLVVWDLAFALGAYHAVFYYRLFQIFVVSTVLQIGSIMLHRSIRVRQWMRVVLCVPLAWFVVHAFAPVAVSTGAWRRVDQVLGWLTLAIVPVILLALVRIMVPGYFALPARRLKVLAVVIICVVAAAGFLVGQFNNHFTTCHDYVIAGDDEPADCRPTPGTPAPSP
jgi:hypothetical protein